MLYFTIKIFKISEICCILNFYIFWKMFKIANFEFLCFFKMSWDLCLLYLNCKYFWLLWIFKLFYKWTFNFFEIWTLALLKKYTIFLSYFQLYHLQNFGLPQHGSLGNNLSRSPGLDGSLGGLGDTATASASYTDSCFSPQVQVLIIKTCFLITNWFYNQAFLSKFEPDLYPFFHSVNELLQFIRL